MAKDKSLLSQTSKPKKVTKYDETPKTKLEYKHSIGDSVIYLGLIEEYKGTIATIIKRSKKHISEYYSIKFSIDDEQVNDIAGGVLKNLEEHELELENKEENSNTDNQEDELINVSEIERKVIESGNIPMKNEK